MFEQLRQNPVLDEAFGIWSAGGWAMIALAIIAFLLFWIGFNVWIRIKSSGFHSVPDLREKSRPVHRVAEVP